jgi:CheY-like chemotaxis protein
MDGEPLLILLVEDNLDHAELIMRTLEDHQISNRVHHISDGQTAIEYLTGTGEFCAPASPARPNIVLLDLRLPRVDGIEVLRIIKETETLMSIPVVILTTSEAEKDLVQAYMHHANSYLVKPVGYEAFIQLMDDLGFYWLARNSTPRF